MTDVEKLIEEEIKVHRYPCAVSPLHEVLGWHHYQCLASPNVALLQAGIAKP
jgi:hypothetical protein